MAEQETGAIGGAVAGAQAGSTFGPWGTVIGAGLGGLAGYFGSKGSGETEAEKRQREIIEALRNLETPSIESQQITPEGYVYGGDVTAQAETPEQLAARDALENVSLDPKLRQTQLQALETLSKLGQTSFTGEEQAQLNAMRRQTEADNTARMKALLQQQQQRGVGTSDAALIMRAQEAQNAANQQAEQTDRLAAMAQQRALAAISGAGSMAGNLENVDYSRQSNLAQALNQREATNMAQRAAAQQRNINALNEFNRLNAANRQAISSQNVSTRNAAEQYNRGLIQQDYQNKIAKITGQMAPAKALSDLSMEREKARNEATSNLISGTAKAAPGIIKSFE
jgi:hypothetical protein